MKLFDENGDLVGEFFQDIIDDAKSDCAGDEGCLLYIIKTALLMLVLYILYILCEAIAIVFKVVVNVAWWVIRLPFSLIIMSYRNFNRQRTAPAIPVGAVFSITL